MTNELQYDVFMSHSSKDKDVVRSLAERLMGDGLRVWFDEWEIHPGDSIPARIEEGLEHSRVLILCMSSNSFGSDWAQLESSTFRFRDPLNKKRRFIPLRLDDAPIKGSLAQLLYINWKEENREQAYTKLLENCLPPANQPEDVVPFVYELPFSDMVDKDDILVCSFSQDRKRALSGSADNLVRLWDVEKGDCLRVFEGHTDMVWSIAWSYDQRLALSGSDDNTLRLWDLETGNCLKTLDGHTDDVISIEWSTDQNRVLTGSSDKTLRLWDLNTCSCVRVLEGHSSGVFGLAWSGDQRRALSGSRDKTVRLWDIDTGRCLRILEGHTGELRSVAWSTNERYALTGSEDCTVRLWDVDTGRCLRVFVGHKGSIWTLAWNASDRHALSGSEDGTVRLWDVVTGRCLQTYEGHSAFVRCVAWGKDHLHILSCDINGSFRVWALPKFIASPRAQDPVTHDMVAAFQTLDQIQYTNAKVLLVGESGAGKTGLSKRLALNNWQPSDSTVGAWATQWKLPIESADGVEREIWLWDFGGQADQRLIHQLYMDETALAILVFDGQKEDLFETLGQWNRDLSRASRNPFATILVAGRVDAGGLRTASRNQIETFVKERGFSGFLETSAKTGEHCDELKQAILNAIRWDEIPCRTTAALFKRLKEEIVCLKDEGRVLLRFNELREILQIRLSLEIARFSDKELKAVVSLLAGPGVVWELEFGSWVLLQPERINAYAQAVIQTLRQDEHERGCLPEERVLNGDLNYHSSMERLEADEERFILLAMHQTLVERGLCLREQTEHGAMLIFPSYYRRERPALVGHPAVLVSYRFNGFLDDIYATLVVRLHHTKTIQKDQLWRYAADFKTLTGKQLGVKLTRRAEGNGELEVYFDPAIEIGEKIIFSKYIHEHLLQNAGDVERLRHYVCPHCCTPVGNRDVAMRKLSEGKKDILCVDCEKRIPLWDELEDLFASDKTRKRVQEMGKQFNILLDNESKERVLVGEVISAVALAGQLSRELSVSDHGIDMEIEFKLDSGEATGQKVYLQLKSGDSYLSKRKSDGAEIFKIDKIRHARYWMNQGFPVLLVIRNSNGDIRWMEVRDWLKQKSNEGKIPVNQIIFEGERFDVMSVRRWREKVLSNSLI